MFYCQFPGGAVPTGAACPDGLDVDRHDARYFQLAADGGHLCQHLCPQVCTLGGKGTVSCGFLKCARHLNETLRSLEFVTRNNCH